MEKLELQLGNHSYDCSLLSFEGEVLEIGMASVSTFRVGDVVYLKQGGNRQSAPIVRKSNHSIYVLVPLTLDTFLNDRRNFPRYNVDVPAKIKVQEAGMHAVYDVQIADVSLKGFGFTLQERLTESSVIEKIFFDFDGQTIEAKLHIINSTQVSNGTRFGTAITFIDQEGFDLLRKFILTEQHVLSKKSWFHNLLHTMFSKIDLRRFQ
jgi:PilZ domain